MSYFCIIGYDRADASAVRRGSKASHVAYLDAGAPGLTVRQSGPLLDVEGAERGSLVVVEAPDLEAAQAFSRADPYVEVDLFAERRIYQWTWRRGNPDLQDVSGSDASVAEVEALEDARYAAMIAGDADSLAPLLHEDLSYVHSSGVNADRETFLAELRAGLWTYLSIVRSEQSALAVGGTVLVRNRLDLAFLRQGVEVHVRSHALAVWLKQGERWRLAAVQSTALPEAA